MNPKYRGHSAPSGHRFSPKERVLRVNRWGWLNLGGMRWAGVRVRIVLDGADPRNGALTLHIPWRGRYYVGRAWAGKRVLVQVLEDLPVEPRGPA